MKKKTSGRQKIDIKKIEKTDSRQVTFTKRRNGLFNKASELCILTGSKVVILVQSIGGRRVFAFAHPDVDSVFDTFLGKRVSNSSDSVSEDNATACMIEEFNKKYLEIVKELEVEKSKANNVEESDGFWWEESFEDLEVDQLEIFVKAMEELKINVTKKADELRDSVTSSSFDTMANANNVDHGLLGDQGIWPNIVYQPLPDNVGVGVGVANQDMLMPAANYDTSGFNNNYSFLGSTSDPLVNDNHDYVHFHDGNGNLQVQSDFGVPDYLYFGQDQI